MSVVYTLTTNPAIDMNVNAQTLSCKRVNRTTDAVYTPNGKGLNVSFVLTHYGVASTILGFFGGFSGRYIVEEAAQRCEVMPVWIEGITRVNIFVTTPEGEYKFPNAGAPVNRTAQLAMLEQLRSARDMSVLVVSGSLSPEIDPTYYDELATVTKELGASLVFDVSHPHLAELLSRRPLLIKPNDEELGDIFGLPCTSDAEALAALDELHRRGARNVLLTLGDKGAWFSNGTSVWRAFAPRVPVLSTACAGDACLAAFLSVWLEKRDAVEEALVRAMATGANVAMSAGLGPMDKVDELAAQIRVERVRSGE